MNTPDLIQQLARLSAQVETISERQTEMAGDIKEIRGWMNQRKGAAAVLLGLGALAGSLAGYFYGGK